MLNRIDLFPKSVAAFGAPLGRRSDAPGNFHGRADLDALHQLGGHGYDSGGAYWGLPSNVWAVFTPGAEAVCYVRAPNKAAAIKTAKEG